MKALRKDFYIQIKRTFNRFISMLLIVALGVAFYVGIRSTEPDMRLSTDADYDDDNIYDIRIVSTLGLNEDDVLTIKDINGVESVEGGYSLDAMTSIKGEDKAIKFMSYSDKINVPNIRDGRNIKADNECIVDKQLADKNIVSIGDTISIDNDSVGVEEFKVVGVYSLANYMTIQKGYTTIGSGTLDGVIVVSKASFDMDCYTDVFVTVEGAKELNCYDDEYEAVVGQVVDEIEEKVKGNREVARYEQIKTEALEEISSANVEYESGLYEYESGSKELESGKIELEDKEKEYESASIEIKDSKVELAESESEYESGSKALVAAKQELNQAREEITSGRGELEAGKKEYESGKKEYQSGLVEYESGSKAYAEGVSKYNAGLKEYESGSKALYDAQELYKVYVNMYGESALLDKKAEIESNSMMLEGASKQLASSNQELKRSKLELLNAKRQLKTSKSALEKAEKKIRRNEKKIKTAEDEIESAGVEIKQKEAEMFNASKKIDDGKAKLKSAESELKSASRKIKKARKKIKKNESKLLDAKKELDDANEDLNDAKEKVDEIEQAEWYVLDRNYIQSYVEYDSNASRIGNIGTVFPIIFFIVAAMVSLTTMTRMVEEERTQIGTLKALGYNKVQIAFKYIAYGALATLIGGFFGGYVGSKIFPYIIITAYKIMFANQVNICMPVNAKHFTVALLAAFISVTGATLLACINELRAVPAKLMRPEAPKSGKRVILERIPFIWNRLNFNYKSTFRNLFRYKKRLVMTLFGIGGCTALMLVGFGVKNSVDSILSLQYSTVNKYDLIFKYNDDIEGDKDNIHNVFKENEYIGEYMDALAFTSDVENGKESVGANIIVPDDETKIDKFISLHDRRTGEKFTISKDGVIITEKMAKLIDAKVGDTILIKESDTKKHKVVVEGIAETYANHFVFMSKDLYESLYTDKFKPTQVFANYEKEPADTDAFAMNLMDNEEIIGVSFIAQITDDFAKSLKSMNAVVIVLIIGAGGLAFIVLYNLNNINIAERKRELATLKVLGFHDKEVSAYVFRENIFITFMGIVLGIIFGIFLHKFVIDTAEIDIMMFGQDIGLFGYIISIILTIVFALMINLSMHFKLKRVDMATSLKSVE